MYPFCVNGRTSMYWDWDDDCAQVFTGSACRNEGKPNAKAGWGLKYGPRKSDDCGGPVPGVQNKKRADIESVKQGLEWAVRLSESKVTVITDNETVAREVYREREPGNEDLWKEVDRLRKSVEGSVQYMPDLGDDGGENYYDIPNANARRAAGFSTPKASSQQSYGSGARGSSGDSSSNSGQGDQPQVEYIGAFTVEESLRPRGNAASGASRGSSAYSGRSNQARESSGGSNSGYGYQPRGNAAPCPSEKYEGYYWSGSDDDYY